MGVLGLADSVAFSSGQESMDQLRSRQAPVFAALLGLFRICGSTG